MAHENKILKRANESISSIGNQEKDNLAAVSIVVES